MRRWDVVLMSAVAMLLVAPWALGQEKKPDAPRRRGGMMQRMSRDDGAPKVGEEAPLFELKSKDGKSVTKLEAFRGKKPVLMFFGSYT